MGDHQQHQENVSIKKVDIMPQSIHTTYFGKWSADIHAYKKYAYTEYVK